MKLPQGFKFSGIVSGLRSEPNRRDLGVIASERPCAAAGVFTTNRVAAAPVQISKARLPRADARGIIVCSGNANACTGELGLRNAERMAELLAKGIGCSAEQVLVASTGVIGRPLPMEIIEPGIPKAVKALDAEYDDFAHAILTTDTKTKSIIREAGAHTVLGIAKGAAMIGPNMATMLGFIMTDAPYAPEELELHLRSAVNDSFNRIAVEGHTSTNDCVLALANGAMSKWKPQPELLRAAIQDVCSDLAMKIIEDAEGGKHLIRITVTGCRNDGDAERIARTVAASALVKTAVYGADPNWGRIVSAAGYSGVAFDERDLSLTMGEMELYRRGEPLIVDLAKASQYLKENHHVVFHLNFTLGQGKFEMLTSDLTEEYVKLNADYTT